MGRSTAPPINGKRIFQERMRLRLTQAQLGQKCAEHGYEMDQGQISRIENGGIKWPSPRSLPALAAALGLSEDEIFAADDEDEPNGAAA